MIPKQFNTNRKNSSLKTSCLPEQLKLRLVLPSNLIWTARGQLLDGQTSQAVSISLHLDCEVVPVPEQPECPCLKQV